MLSMRYLRCTQVPKLRIFLGEKGGGVRIPCQIRTSLERQVNHRQPIFIPVRHFVRRKLVDGFKTSHARDGVPETFRLIYYNGTMGYFTYGIPVLYTLLTCCVSAMGILLYKRYFSKDPWKPNPKQQRGRYAVGDPTDMLLTGMPFMLIILAMTTYMSRRMAMRIYHDASTDQYMARVLHYGVVKRTLKFTQDDIKRRTNVVNYFFHGNVLVKNKDFKILETYFTTLADYNRFMGYDVHRSSDLRMEIESDDIQKMLQQGLEHAQNSKYRSFEQKYLEKRKLRNAR